jgi:hypothetical protein
MSITVLYNDIDDQPVTLQQSGKLKEYKKVYLVNENIKKIEIYVDGVVDETQYIKADDEDINDIFSVLGTNSVTVIINEEYKAYMIRTFLVYANGLIMHTVKNLLSGNKIICNHEYDASGNLNHHFSEKYIYNEKGFHIGEEIFSFKYNADGTLNYISGRGYPFSEHNPFLEASEITKYFPNLLINNPYYKDASFLPK